VSQTEIPIEENQRFNIASGTIVTVSQSYFNSNGDISPKK